MASRNDPLKCFRIGASLHADDYDSDSDSYDAFDSQDTRHVRVKVCFAAGPWIHCEIEQLELWVEQLEAAATQRSSVLAEQAGFPSVPSIPKPRREFPAHLPRETLTIAPHESSCPGCGGELKHLGEDVCEMLECAR